MGIVASLLSRKPSGVVEQVDDLGHEAAESLHGAASSIRKRAQEGAKAIEKLAESTASGLDGAGSYIEEHDLTQTINESRQLVGRYPVESLILAAGVGFLTGFAIRRLTHVCARTEAPVVS
jgi:ElaB/YqjD/DUF883 family membrane-anchored ribosome-binding protein